jgi:hypothetical protein
VQGRTTWYERVEAIDADLDRFLLYYNHERSLKAIGCEVAPRPRRCGRLSA